MATTITSEKVEQVGPLAGMRKRQPKKLPLTYYIPYVFWVTKSDDELSEDEALISEYVFDNV